MPEQKQYLDKHGNPREPYEWELRDPNETAWDRVKKNMREDREEMAQRRANRPPMSGTKLFFVIVGALFFFFVLAPTLLWVIGLSAIA